MKHVLAAANVELLAQLAWSRVLLAFDFDGTLAPIVSDRQDANMRARTRKLMEQLCRRYPCAVISGRARGDVEGRLAGLPLRHVIGNHGLEPGSDMPAFERAIALIRPQLEAALAPWVGVEIEDKRYSLAVHYRRSRQKREARRAIVAAVTTLTLPMRVIAGKAVVNIVPDQALNKGGALLALRAAERADTALYVGDDITDEDVFELDQPGRLFTIRVGASRSSAAGYFLRDQREIDRLLSTLVALREERT